ncbi:hypothetical protein HAZT_HAZT003196 [Hyalella azteca]|uniref:Ig-like domain-containing protein n=1 Tax=Hyalella azteca TaxID=294128 RepID=A0A6A0GZ85_HYAAZ|nr:hypothetical protein HAZT_HAZT003196 [Hyalella azteca]
MGMAPQTRMESLQEGTREDASVDSSVLWFMPERKHHGLPLACVASQEDRRLKPVTASKRLEVYYPPSAVLKPGRSVNLSAIEEGDDLYVECVVDASPPAYKIVWYHQGQLLDQNVSAGIILSNQSLVLQRARRQHAGVYSCLASNIEGDGASNAITLTVKFAPVCRGPAWQYRGASLMEVLQATCQLDALPPVQSVTWTFNNTGEIINISNIFPAGELKNLCVVQIFPAGEFKNLCVVQIFPAGELKNNVWCRFR